MNTKNRVHPCTPSVRSLDQLGECLQTPVVTSSIVVSPKRDSHSILSQEAATPAIKTCLRKLVSTQVWVNAVQLMVLVSHNLAITVGCAFLMTYLCSLGIFSSKSLGEQSYTEFLTASMIISHFFNTTTVLCTEASFLAAQRFRTCPDRPPRFLFCIWKLCSGGSIYFFFFSAALLYGMIELIAYVAPVSVRRFKLEYYFHCWAGNFFTASAILVTRRVFQQQTAEGQKRQRSRPYQTSNVRKWRHSIRKYVRTYLAYVPMVITVSLAGVYVHVVSHFTISTQWGMFFFGACSVGIKLVAQELTKKCILKHNIRDIRTMSSAVGLPTVMIDTQLRCAMQRLQNTQVTVQSTLLLAFVEIAMRGIKVIRVRREIRYCETSPRLPSSLMSRLNLRQLKLSKSSAASQLSTSGTSFSKATFVRWKSKLIAYHSAEIYADMTAEYIAMGCTACIYFFYWRHPKYDLEGTNVMASSSCIGEIHNLACERNKQFLSFSIQLGVEVVVDFISSILEISAGIDFGELRKHQRFLVCFFTAVAVINIEISTIFYMKNT